MLSLNGGFVIFCFFTENVAILFKGYNLDAFANRPNEGNLYNAHFIIRLYAYSVYSTLSFNAISYLLTDLSK